MKQIVNKYLKEIDPNVIEEKFDFNKSIKNRATIEDKLNTIAQDYEPKTHVQIEDKKRVVTILNRIKNNLLDYYLDLSTVVKLHQIY